MCDRSNFEEDTEVLPRGLYYLPDLNSLTYEESKRNLELVALTTEPSKLARAILSGKTPNLIGSKILDSGLMPKNEPNDKHGPLFDLDMPHRYKPSSTKGHGHLIIDVVTNKNKYLKMLETLQRTDLQQTGFVNQMKYHGQTFIRWNTTKEV